MSVIKEASCDLDYFSLDAGTADGVCVMECVCVCVNGSSFCVDVGHAWLHVV